MAALDTAAIYIHPSSTLVLVCGEPYVRKTRNATICNFYAAPNDPLPPDSPLRKEGYFTADSSFAVPLREFAALDAAALELQVEATVMRAVRAGLPEARERAKAPHRPCFQLYGIDLHVGSDGTVWFLEANVGPDLSSHGMASLGRAKGSIKE